MRNLLFLFILLLITLGLTALTSCGNENGKATGTGTLIADFYLEGDELLAVSDSPVQRLCEIFHARAADALPSLGFNANDYPYNHLSSVNHVQGDLNVILDNAFQQALATTQTSNTGHVQFTDINSGFLTLVIIGKDGTNYSIPTQIADQMTSRCKVLIYRSSKDGKQYINAKTIHDENGDGVNDDDFSFSLFGRHSKTTTGGLVLFHENGKTFIDPYGDGDFTGSEDSTIIEPDDDGVASDSGDGDEDNDGILDNADPDIDGDGIPNETDPDIDGDGILNATDPFPNGITPLDDFTPPGLSTSLGYTGVQEAAAIDTTSISVFFPEAVEEKHPPVTYLVFYSTTTPIDFTTAASQMFIPSGGATDGVFSDNITGLIAGQTYYVAVRVRDRAQPPNVDPNTKEIKVTLGS